jgi:protein kinase C substrate 80K-H
MLLLYILLLPLTSQAASAVDKTFGVAPDLVSKYVPTNGKWRCLDGSEEIPWDFVNDDSCDCTDGSDEPGASILLELGPDLRRNSRNWCLPRHVFLLS